MMIMRCAASLRTGFRTGFRTGLLTGLLIAAIPLSSAALAFDAAAEDVAEIDAAAANAGSENEASPDGPATSDLVTLGFIENVSVGNRALEMKGKLDTGADTSSVHARNVSIYKRGERDHWVKFRLVGKNGRAIRYDQNVIRFASIKTKTGGNIRRPVIRLPLCVGGKWGVAEVNLADRGDFDYEILIGREFLADRALIDSGKKFIAEAPCEPPDDN